MEEVWCLMIGLSAPTVLKKGECNTDVPPPPPHTHLRHTIVFTYYLLHVYIMCAEYALIFVDSKVNFVLMC